MSGTHGGHQVDTDASGLSEGIGASHSTIPLSIATLVRDDSGWLSTTNTVLEHEIVILLTPLVPPLDKDQRYPEDPFELLGRALARRGGKVRHAPYSQLTGINSIHAGFIQRGQQIILCTVPFQGSLDLQPAELAFTIRENVPFILVVCCDVIEAEAIQLFPTIIRSDDYSPAALEAVAALIYDNRSNTLARTLSGSGLHSQNSTRFVRATPTPSSSQLPQLWPVIEWDEARDVTGVCNLWSNFFQDQFKISQAVLASLLRRPGYAKHYVVRQSDDVLGFCATYLSYIDKEGENLIASIAILIVHPSWRDRGIGLSLHSHAIANMRRTRGVLRLQLGSIFPRILYGPPANITHQDWFRRRGWKLDKPNVPGQGHMVYDLVLDIANWRVPAVAVQTRVLFRLCKREDMPVVLQIVENTHRMCWFDQYSCLVTRPNVKDVVLATANGQIIAVALTYTPACGSQVAENLPWAGEIGEDVGGITCICVSPNDQSSVEFGLLNFCVQILQAQGMRRVFLDGVTEGLEHMKSAGFREWAIYLDVWKNI